MGWALKAPSHTWGSCDWSSRRVCSHRVYLTRTSNPPTYTHLTSTGADKRLLHLHLTTTSVLSPTFETPYLERKLLYSKEILVDFDERVKDLVFIFYILIYIFNPILTPVRHIRVKWRGLPVLSLHHVWPNTPRWICLTWKGKSVSRRCLFVLLKAFQRAISLINCVWFHFIL